MARIAVDTVVDVARNACVARSSCGCRMATGASEDRIVRRVSVAGSTHAVGIAMPQWEKGVITRGKGGGKPCRRCMAGGAGCGPARGDVVGIGSACEIRLVARIAVSRCSREDVVDVTLIASDCNVRPGQREGRVVVIERGAGP